MVRNEQGIFRKADTAGGEYEAQAEQLCRLCPGSLRFPVYADAGYMQADIEALELSVRSYNCLKRAGFVTVRDLLKSIHGREDLFRIRNCGKRSVEEIMLHLFRYQIMCLRPESRGEYLQEVRELNGLCA